MMGIGRSFNNTFVEHLLFYEGKHQLTSSNGLDYVKSLAASHLGTVYKTSSSNVTMEWEPILWNLLNKPVLFKAKGVDYFISVGERN